MIQEPQIEVISADESLLPKVLIAPPKLNLNKEKKMSMSETKGELQILLNAIPEFGPRDNLSIFISEVDNLALHLNNKLNSDQLYIFNFSIRSKIKGEAREYVQYEDARDWPSIRSALLRKYGDQRSEDLLISAVSNSAQKRGEPYLDYYFRILKSFNELMRQVVLTTTDPQLVSFKKNTYEKLALKTFTNGLLEPYRSHLSHFQLGTIEECLNKCSSLDNQSQEWSHMEFLRRSEENKKLPKQNHLNQHNPQKNPFNNQPFANQRNPFNPQTQNPFNQQMQNQMRQNFMFRPPQQYQPQNQQNQFYNHHHQQQQQQQYQKPRMLFPNNLPPPQPKQFFTNKQVFGTKPGSNIVKPFTPQPMSTSSRVPSVKIQQNPPIGPQIFSQELTNLETTDETDNLEFDYSFDATSENIANYDFQEPLIENEQENFQIETYSENPT